MADIYPGAPGQSGSTDNLAGVLGIGAFSLPSPDGGGAGNFGQMITENFVRSFITSTAMNMGAGDGSLGDIVSNLTDYLSQLELSSLKWLQPFIPGATDEDFSTTAGAVDKIIEALNLQLLMGVQDFQHWIDSVFSGLQTAFNQVVDIFNNLVVVPINSSIQAIKDWWNTYTSQNPLWNQMVTWFNQVLTSLGIPVGSGAGNSVGSQIYTAGATANGAKAQADQQLAWAKRKSQNDRILNDWTFYYPFGSPSDTRNTLVGGKPTRWGAWNDNWLIFGEQLGVAPPTTPDLVDAPAQAQATAAAASLASSNAAAAAAANQDLTNKIIGSQTGVEPTNGTTSDARDALQSIPASNIQGQYGALPVIGAGGSGNATSGLTTTLNTSWTITPTARDTMIVVLLNGTGPGNTSDGSGISMSATYGGVAMTPVGSILVTGGKNTGGAWGYSQAFTYKIPPGSNLSTRTVAAQITGGTSYNVTSIRGNAYAVSAAKVSNLYYNLASASTSPNSVTAPSTDSSKLLLCQMGGVSTGNWSAFSAPSGVTEGWTGNSTGGTYDSGASRHASASPASGVTSLTFTAAHANTMSNPQFIGLIVEMSN